MRTLISAVGWLLAQVRSVPLAFVAIPNAIGLGLVFSQTAASNPWGALLRLALVIIAGITIGAWIAARELGAGYWRSGVAGAMAATTAAWLIVTASLTPLNESLTGALILVALLIAASFGISVLTRRVLGVIRRK